MRRALAPAVLVVLAGATLASAWQTTLSQHRESGLQLGEERRLIAQKLRNATRMPYYEFTKTSGPRFRLSGSETKLRLITHVLLPPNAAYNPEFRLRYGARIRILDGDRSILDFEVHTQTRQSKDRKVGDIWLDENAFTRDPDVQITDDRLFLLYMPEDVPADAIMEVTLIGSDVDEGLIRVYVDRARSPSGQRTRARGLGPRARWNLLWTNTYENWDMIPELEKMQRLRRESERLPVIGKSDVDYRLRTIRYTGFRLPVEVLELIGPQPLEVHRERFAAINVQGPTQLRFAVRLAPDEDSGSNGDSNGNGDSDSDGANDDGPSAAPPPVMAENPDSKLDIGAVAALHDEQRPGDSTAPSVADRGAARGDDASDRRSLLTLSVPAQIAANRNSLTEWVYEIPPGLHSVHLRTRSYHPLQVWVRGPRDTAFGAPADVGKEIGRLYPDYIRVPIAVTGPRWTQPVTIAGPSIPGPERSDPLDRQIKVEARFFATRSLASTAQYMIWLIGEMPLRITRLAALRRPVSDADPPALSGVINARFYARDGRLLEAHSARLAAARARFEWLEFAAEKPVPIPVSEPASLRIITPPNTARIDLTTSRAAAVRLYRPLPGERLYELPYRTATLSEDVRWRYARIEKRVWWPKRALNHRQLAEAEQMATLHAQARLELRGPSTRDSDGRRRSRRVKGIVVKPLGQHEQHTILEPVPDVYRAEELADWRPGALAEVPRDRDHSYQWSEQSYRSARLFYWLDPGDVGGELSVEIDGQPGPFAILRTTTGYIELPALAAGAHNLRARSLSPSLRLYIDRPPLETADGATAPAELRRRRQVYAMTSAPMTVQVRKLPGRRPTLNLVAYTPLRIAQDNVRIRCIIGGGRPARLAVDEAAGLSTDTRPRPLPDDTRKEYTLPASNRDRPARFTDSAGGEAGYPHTIPIGLPGDLIPGPHQVQCSVTGRTLWVRFFVTNSEVEYDEKSTQWKVRQPR
ncbi:MAG: hypothetical protein AAGC55_04150 [Myxococcota bacterium]